MITIRKKELKIFLWNFGGRQGKTNLLYKICKNMTFENSEGTNGVHVETTNFNGIKMNFMEIGGGYLIKLLRNEHIPNSDAVIFLIDSSHPLDDDSSTENIKDLQECIKAIEDKPLLIVITKIDIRKTSTLDIINTYQLNDLYERKEKFGIIECSSYSSQGTKEILFWLSSLK